MTHDEKKKEVELLLKAYQKVISEGNPELMHHLGCAFYYKRFYGEACELFRAAVMLRPDYHEAHSFLGLTELALGRPQEAVDALQKAVQRQPNYADYHNNLGMAYLKADSCGKAVAEFERALRINLYYADAYYNLGRALISNAISRESTELFNNLVSRATDYFKKAQLINSDYSGMNFEQGLEHLRTSELDRSRELFDALYDQVKEKHRQGFATYYMKFVLYPEWVSERVITDRIAFLENEIAKNPTYVDLYADLAHCFLEVSRINWKKGIEQYHKALEINPSLSRVRASVETAEDTMGELVRALSVIADKG
jgi:tetratricopeptide (TPR) repeat protein